MASFAYLTREPENLSGVLSLPALTQMAGMEMDGDMAGMDMSPDGEMPMPGHSGTATSESAAHDHGPHAPSPHNHAAHCPFCFSAAFALEAQGFDWQAGAAQQTEFLSLPYSPPHLLTLRHAQARAPPIFQR